MSLELQLEEEHVCWYKPFLLLCKHPDLNEKKNNGQYYYSTGTPVWEQDGQIITLDSVVYFINYVNNTHTRLIVVPDSMIFSASHTFTCLVKTTEGIAVRSNNVTVYPGLGKHIVGTVMIISFD